MLPIVMEESTTPEPKGQVSHSDRHKKKSQSFSVRERRTGGGSEKSFLDKSLTVTSTGNFSQKGSINDSRII